MPTTQTEIDVYQIRPSTTPYQIVGTNSGATVNEYLSIVGTTHQIGVTNSGTSITLSTPQNIDTTSSPTFTAATVTNLFIGGVASDPVSPTEGQVWYNTTTHQWVGYNGTSNIVIG